MHVHNILILTWAARHTCKFCLSTTSGNHTINHVRGTDKTIHNQPGTMFPHLIRAKYHQITLTHSITLAFSTSIIRCINFPDSVELFKTVPDVDEPFWKGHIEAGHQNNFQPSLWPGQKSGRIDLTSKNYFLRPETRHRPHQSSQYNAFPSQARDQCFTRLAKMRPNTVTYWTTADFANRKTFSFMIWGLMMPSGKLCRQPERNLEN